MDKKALEEVARRSTMDAVEAEAKLKQVESKRQELEKLIDDHYNEMNDRLKGMHQA